jgi:hypothetical protein
MTNTERQAAWRNSFKRMREALEEILNVRTAADARRLAAKALGKDTK